jgi:hypothetical protein
MRSPAAGLELRVPAAVLFWHGRPRWPTRGTAAPAGRPAGSLPSEVGEPSRRQQPACSWWCVAEIDGWRALGQSWAEHPAAACLPSRPTGGSTAPRRGARATSQRRKTRRRAKRHSSFSVRRTLLLDRHANARHPHRHEQTGLGLSAGLQTLSLSPWTAPQRRTGTLLLSQRGGHSPLRLHPAAGRHIGLHGRRKTNAHQETHLATLPRFYNAGRKQGRASQPGTTRPASFYWYQFLLLLFCGWVVPLLSPFYLHEYY